MPDINSWAQEQSRKEYAREDTKDFPIGKDHPAAVAAGVDNTDSSAYSQKQAENASSKKRVILILISIVVIISLVWFISSLFLKQPEQQSLTQETAVDSDEILDANVDGSVEDDVSQPQATSILEPTSTVTVSGIPGELYTSGIITELTATSLTIVDGDSSKTLPISLEHDIRFSERQDVGYKIVDTAPIGAEIISLFYMTPTPDDQYVSVINYKIST